MHESAAPVPALSITGLQKVFGGAIALSDANLEVWPGEIHGLLGENGAGKSTLIKALAGAIRADGGTIAVGGEPLPVNHDPEAAKAAGLAFIHQDLGLIGDLSVAENIALAVGYKRRGLMIDWGGVEERATEVLRAMGVQLDPGRLVSELPLATQSTVAIARALAGESRVLVLDEPTASLAAGEVDALFKVLRTLRSRGLAMVFVSHRMDEVYALCDRVTVLRDGRTVGVRDVAGTPSRELFELILGAEQPESLTDQDSDRSFGPPRLVVDGLEGPTVGPLSFDVGAGEVLGITGLSDSGHHELGDLLFGRVQRTRGEITLDGAAYEPDTPRDAMGRGVAYVPADRSQGTASGLTLQENLFANPSRQHRLYRESRWVRPRAERRESREILKRYRVNPAAPSRELSTMSGGNAQKVMLAKSFATRPSLTILNEPTTGVDVGARQEIHRLLRQEAASGSSAVVITSDFEEVVQVCDRVIVLYRGSPSRHLAGTDVTDAAIRSAAISPGRTA